MKKIMVLMCECGTSIEDRNKIGFAIKRDFPNDLILLLNGIKGQPVKFEMFTDEKIAPIELAELKAKLKL